MPKDSLNAAEAKDMLNEVADAIIEAEPILTDADRALGDGDHGLGMERGMKAAKEALAEGEFSSVNEPFTAMGQAMMSSMGGASGVVFGSLFRATGKALKRQDSFDGAGMADGFQAAVETIMKRGGAKAGDKTMLDALIPAAEKAAEVKDQPLHEALEAVAAAGEAGKEASKPMRATMGRAKTLGDRSIGLPDAGAVSITIILETMRAFAAR